MSTELDERVRDWLRLCAGPNAVWKAVTPKPFENAGPTWNRNILPVSQLVAGSRPLVVPDASAVSEHEPERQAWQSVVELLQAGADVVCAVRASALTGPISALLDFARYVDCIEADGDEIDQRVDAWRALSKWATEEVETRSLLRTPVLAILERGGMAVQVVRAARRLADTRKAKLIVVYAGIDRERARGFERRSFDTAIRLADRLGAEVIDLPGRLADSVADLVAVRKLEIAVASRPSVPWWHPGNWRSTSEQLLRTTDSLDLRILASSRPARRPWSRLVPEYPVSLRSAIISILVPGTIAAAHSLVEPRLDLASASLTYVLGVAWVASRFGHVEALLASLTSILAMSVLHAQSAHPEGLLDAHFLVFSIVMLGVGLMLSSLALEVRRQADESRRAARRSSALDHFSKSLLQCSSHADLIAATVAGVRETTGLEATVVFNELPNGPRDDRIEPAGIEGACDRRFGVGAGEPHMPKVQHYYSPLVTSETCIGVLVVFNERPMPVRQRELLDSFARSLALAVSRISVDDTAKKQVILDEREKFRSALLSSVSHDLRTPLAIISAASENLQTLPNGGAESREMLQTLVHESQRLDRQVNRLLTMARLQAGPTARRDEAHVVDDLVEEAHGRVLAPEYRSRVHISAGDELMLIRGDGGLISQALGSLFEAALEQCDDAESIKVSIARSGEDAHIVVCALCNESTKPKIAAYQSADPSHGDHLVGDDSRLGLLVAKAVFDAHGAPFTVSSEPHGGACYVVQFQIEALPQLEGEHITP